MHYLLAIFQLRFVFCINIIILLNYVKLYALTFEYFAYLINVFLKFINYQ